MGGGAFGLLIVDEPTTTSGSAIPAWAREPAQELLLQVARGNGKALVVNGLSSAADSFALTSGTWFRLRTSLVDTKAQSATWNFVQNQCQID